MGHKKAGVRLGLSVLAIAILVPLGSRVNHLVQASHARTGSRTLRVDGTPIPPLPPPKGTLVADGTPIPPLPPPKGTLVADGTPIPPLPPPKDAVEGFKILLADGTPIPPLPPPKDSSSQELSSLLV
jgi:hypothetical protein